MNFVLIALAALTFSCAEKMDTDLEAADPKTAGQETARPMNMLDKCVGVWQASEEEGEFDGDDYTVEIALTSDSLIVEISMKDGATRIAYDVDGIVETGQGWVGTSVSEDSRTEAAWQFLSETIAVLSVHSISTSDGHSLGTQRIWLKRELGN